MKDEVINADEIVLLSAAISVELAHGMTVNQITNFANLLLMVGTNFQYIAGILTQGQSSQNNSSSEATQSSASKTKTKA